MATSSGDMTGKEKGEKSDLVLLHQRYILALVEFICLVYSLLICQVRVTGGDSGLCCSVPSYSFDVRLSDAIKIAFF